MAVTGFLATGQAVGRYRIERLLGEGGMGQVYQATHTVLGKPAAIKLLNREYSSKKEYVTRFFNEARAAASLDHLNIIDVLDLDQLPDGRFYMVLEYLEGETLEALLAREAPLSPDAMFDILAPIGSAITAAHAKGIVHRDLKPSNVFLVRRGGAERLVKVLDFGVAKLLDAADADITRTGALIGTPRYMSPEQARGKAAGPQSDIYSLGVMAYAMLTGTCPFDGGTTEVVLQQASDAPPPLRGRRPDLPAALEAVVQRALEKEPRDRWPAVGDLVSSLARAIGRKPDDSTLSGASGVARSGKSEHLGAWSVAIGAIVLVAVALAATATRRLVSSPRSGGAAPPVERRLAGAGVPAPPPAASDPPAPAARVPARIVTPIAGELRPRPRVQGSHPARAVTAAPVPRLPVTPVFDPTSSEPPP